MQQVAISHPDGPRSARPPTARHRPPPVSSSRRLRHDRPRADARPSGLEAEIGRGRNPRPAGPRPGGATALSRGARHQAERAVGTFQSRHVLPSDQGPAAPPKPISNRRPASRAPTAACRQNLALAVGLQGRFAGSRDRSPARSFRTEQAEANVAYLRSYAFAAGRMEESSPRPTAPTRIKPAVHFTLALTGLALAGSFAWYERYRKWRGRFNSEGRCYAQSTAP